MTALHSPRADAALPRAAVARERHLHVELTMSTHLTVVVRACVEFDDGTPPLEVPLVIARRRCRGDCPTGRALQEAGPEWLGQWQRTAHPQRGTVGRLLACIDGRWQALVDVREARLAA